MVELVRPGPQAAPSRAQISEGLAATAGAGLGAIGQQLTSAGRQFQQTSVGALSRQLGALVSAEGERYFEESKAAHQSTVLNNAMTEATMQYLQASDERTKRVVDNNGNPTYPNLVDDVGAIGSDVMNRISSKIIDPEVQRRFRTDFNAYVNSQKISAFKKARSQQRSLGRSALDKGLMSIFDQALSDPEALPEEYVGRAQQSLNDALAAGLISSEEHAKRLQEFDIIIREGIISKGIERRDLGVGLRLGNPQLPTTQPQTVEEIPKIGFEKSAEQAASEAGVSVQFMEEKREEFNVAVGEEMRQSIEAVQEVQIAEEASRGRMAEDFEKRIQADSLPEDELLRAQRLLAPKTFKELKRKLIKRAKDRAKETIVDAEISSSIASGDGIGEFKTKDVNRHFMKMVEAAEQLENRQLNLAEQSEIASAYKGPIEVFAKKVDNAILVGSSEMALDAINAYTYSRDRDSRSLDKKLSTKAMRVAELTEMYIERADMDPSTALRKVRDKFDNITQEDRQVRNSFFNAEPDMKIQNLMETTADDLGIEFFGANLDVPIGVAADYKELVRSAYTDTGDIEEARKLATAQMNRTHGFSVFNDGDYMAFPPEKMFPNTPVDSLEKDFAKDLMENGLPEGVDVGDVVLSSDELTRGNFARIVDERGDVKKVEVVSYSVSIIKEVDGVEILMPLKNEQTGGNFRWTPDINRIQSEARQARIDREERTVFETELSEVGKRFIDEGADIGDLP